VVEMVVVGRWRLVMSLQPPSLSLQSTPPLLTMRWRGGGWRDFVDSVVTAPVLPIGAAGIAVLLKDSSNPPFLPAATPRRRVGLVIADRIHHLLLLVVIVVMIAPPPAPARQHCRRRYHCLLLLLTPTNIAL
jgi:hypothetical protein